MTDCPNDAAITASGKRRRDRKKRLKRLGFEHVTLYVPKGEVKALKRDMAVKVKAAEARKAMADLERVTGDQLSDADPQQNMADPDVLAGVAPTATAAPNTGNTHTPTDTTPQGILGLAGIPTPGNDHDTADTPELRPTLPGSAPDAAQPRRPMSDRELEEMLNGAQPSYMQQGPF